MKKQENSLSCLCKKQFRYPSKYPWSECYPNGNKQNEQSQFFVALFEGVSQALEAGGVTGEFEDPNNSHYPEKLSNSSDLHEVVAVLANALANYAHIIPRNFISKPYH